MRVVEPIVELARGLWTTLHMMVEKPVTVQYPEVKKPVKPRFRGRHALKRYDNGLEKCIGCSLCAAACPADAIFVESSENSDLKKPVKPRFRGRHALKRYDNGLEKCIGCSLCAAACPADAIFVESSENTD